MELIEILKLFKGVIDEPSEKMKLDSLNNQFSLMAEELLYGGYFLIDNEKKIYLDDVEFYYHEEEANLMQKGVKSYSTNGLYNGKIKDPIMYHTNDHEGRELPYFKIGRLHLHASGVDVTFENGEKHYRASFLIRGFHVEGEKPDLCSTHIFDEMLYMGVPLGKPIEIKWIADSQPEKHAKLQGSPRKNVAEEYQYELYKNGSGVWKKSPTSDNVSSNFPREKYFRSSKKNL